MEVAKLNENADRIEGNSLLEVTVSTWTVGVLREYLQFSGGRRLTLTAPAFVSAVKRWMNLPKHVRKEAEA